MPAMPQEKATAVALKENTFVDLTSKTLHCQTSAEVSTVSNSIEIDTVLPKTTSIGSLMFNTVENEALKESLNFCACNDVLENQETNSSHQAMVVPVIPPNRGEAFFHRKNNEIMTKSTDKINKSEAITSKASPPVTPKKSPNDYIFGKYIGEGSFSIVYLAVDLITKREYAIKVCEKRHILREHKQEYIRREREVMHMMTNVPGFVNLSCTFQDNRSLYFVMTYAKNGDMLPYINKVGSFDLECTKHYAAELVLACEEMHRRNIVHRDLKPENILLDEKMHTLIADFGSAKIILSGDLSTVRNNSINSAYTIDGEENDLERSANYQNKRKGSFVGTAQYVSPEVLQNGPITPAADLWALGCIIYQMISGLPPFRGSNDYVIFKEVLACNLTFPQGFDASAEDLVRQLLKVDPNERLGAKDANMYLSIRSHPFFASTNFEKIREITPPPIYPYLPGFIAEGNFPANSHLSENLEPGLDDKQVTRLLSVELGTTVDWDKRNVEKKTEHVKNSFDLTSEDKKKILEQQKTDKWHIFAENEVIFKKGFVNKRKGLFARKRMLLLTTGPRLIYIDPVQMIKKGEIPWTSELRVEAKNFKIFFVHTPNRTYYLDDPEGYSLEWVEAIVKMHELSFKNKKNGNEPMATSKVSK